MEPYVNRGPVTRVVAALIVAVPLVFVPGGFAPFGPIKWLLVSTLGFGVAALLLLGRAIPVKRRWVTGWVAFLLWGIVVSIAAVDPVSTWIGTPDRHLGLLTWALFGVFFIAGLAAHDRPRVLLIAAVLAMLGIGGYVLVELVGFEPVELAVSSGRPGGPFGSPAYLGAACALLLPIVTGAAVDGLGSPRWRATAWASAGLGLIAALAAQSRAAWVGLAAAAILATPALLRWVRAHRSVVVAAGLGLVLVSAVSPIGSRLTSAVDFESGGARGRIDEWRVGGAVLARHPVTGLGFEGYRIGFAEGADAAYEQRYGRTYAPDRAHNGALDVGLTAGIPGMMAYLAALAALLMAAARGARTGRAWLVGLGAGVTGYLIQQQFLFPVVEVDPVFWVFAGLLVAATSNGVRRWVVPGGLWLIPAALAAAALVAGVLDVGADRATRTALDADREGRASAALAEIGRAVELRPDSIRYGFVAASLAARADSASGYRLAVHRIDDALAISPDDPILLEASARYRFDLAVAERDADGLEAAIRAWEALVERDPHHAQYRLDLGIAYAVAGRTDAAEAQWREAASLAPSSAAPWLNLASLFLDARRIDDAAAAIERIRVLDPAAPDLPELAARLAGILRDN